MTVFSKPSRTASSPLRTASSLPLLNCHFGETALTAARMSPLDQQLFGGLARLPAPRSSTASPKAPIRLLPKSASSSPTRLPSPLPSPPTLMRPLISERPREDSVLLGLSGMAPASGPQRPASVLWAKPGAAVFSPDARPRDHIGERFLKPRELAPEDDSPVSDDHAQFPDVAGDATTNSDAEPELLVKRATSEGTDALWADAERYMKRMRLDSMDGKDISM